MGIRLVVVVCLLLWASVAHATLFQVTNTNDTGVGSLRNAITNANGAQGTNTIAINVSGTITLATPLPAAGFTLTITGPGASEITIAGSAAASPVLAITGTVQLSGVTISGGANPGGNGGGIAVTSGALTLLDSVITGNSALSGSAIFSTGTLTIRRSTITGNVGTGAVFGGGDTTVTESTIADNQGTAIVFSSASKTLTIDRVTISGNMDAGGVGGLQLQGGTANVRNATFSGNSGAQAGDFWTFSDGVTLSLVNVTATGGSAPALLFDHASTVMLRNTVLAGTGRRCSAGGLPTSQGHNLSSDATCNLTGVTDKPGVDPLLGPLAANGGTTRTHLPMADSPALNAGDSASLETLDQRGKPRIQFGVADIGAVEAVEPVISVQPVAKSLVEGDGFMLTVTAMNQDSTAPLKFQWRKDGTAIAGATSETFSKLDATPTDSGMYDVLVINDGGGLPSTAVAVTVMGTVKGDGIPDDGGGGGCCSSARGAGWPSTLLGLMLAACLGIRRRRRAVR